MDSIITTTKFGYINPEDIRLSSKNWVFALPKRLNWRALRAVGPRITEPDGRYFIHCIQHKVYIIGKRPTCRFDCKDFYLLTLLIDNHGQTYRIRSTKDSYDDMGVYWFEIIPNNEQFGTPLIASQIAAVKLLEIEDEPGYEGNPHPKQFPDEIIRKTIADNVDPNFIYSSGPMFDTFGKRGSELPLCESDISDYLGPLGSGHSTAGSLKKPRQPKPLPPPKYHADEDYGRSLKDSYVLARYGKNDMQRNTALEFLRGELARWEPTCKNIETATRTTAARKLGRLFGIQFPSANAHRA